MKLNELANQSKYTIACDMDGVLADFDEGVVSLLGIPSRDSISNNELWRRLDALIVAGVPTYGTLPLMRDARELWEYIEKHNPFILTSTGHRHPEPIAREKKEWIKQHISSSVKVITVQHSHLKAEYASPTTILIDDRSKSIDPWIAAGGIGILHKNASDTIRQLKDLGI